MKHNESIAACESLDMELVSVPNLEFQDDLISAVLAFGIKNHFWTSGNDEEYRNSFQWVGRTLPSGMYSFTNWAAGNPVNQATGAPSYIVVNKDNRQWSNYPNSITQGAVCVSLLEDFALDNCVDSRTFIGTMAQNDITKQDIISARSIWCDGKIERKFVESY